MNTNPKAPCAECCEAGDGVMVYCPHNEAVSVFNEEVGCWTTFSPRTLEQFQAMLEGANEAMRHDT